VVVAVTSLLGIDQHEVPSDDHAWWYMRCVCVRDDFVLFRNVIQSLRVARTRQMMEKRGYNVFLIHFKEVWFNVVYMFWCTWAMIMPLLLPYLVTKYCTVLYPNRDWLHIMLV
jgi:hypothetical protein